jgi:hypothetical protein
MDDARLSYERDQEMLGQALKGMLAGFGAGNGISKLARPIEVPVIEEGQLLLSPELLAVCEESSHGDVLVVASKVVALSERRILRFEGAPPSLSRANTDALRRVLQEAGSAGDDRDLVMLDHIAGTTVWTVSLADPNRTAADLAEAVQFATGTWLDVVISDSGAGVVKGSMLIGCTTYVATPIGATAGLSLVQAQRCAAAAEVVRNAQERSPYVLINSDLDIRRRHDIGAFRYGGYLDATREDAYTIPAV